MVDKIKPLKIENAALGGTENDPFPTEADPSEDYVATKGLAFENNDNRLVNLDGSGNIQFKDATETTAVTVRQLRTASNNIFNNSSNDFNASNVQTAVEELFPNSTTIVTDGTAHQLTRYSNRSIEFTGTTANTILRLPDATTFIKAGHLFDVWNYSDQMVNIEDYDENILAELRPNSRTIIKLRDFSTTAGIWGITYTLDNGNVFGTEITFAQDTSETSTTSNSVWSTKVTLTTDSDLSEGDYLLSFQFIWRSSNSDREMDVRLRHSSTTLLAWVPSTSRVLDQSLISGFYKVASISGANTFTLEFKRGGSTGSATIYMKEARMYIMRIA